MERTLIAGSSKPILECMQSQGRGVGELLKHNFYTNKFDTTGWRIIYCVHDGVECLVIYICG